MHLKNDLIVDMAFRLNLVEKLGSGINRIKDLCSKLELPVDFNISHDWFTLIFYRRLQDGSFSVNAGETTQKTTQKILDLLKENPNYSRKELANLIGNITEDGIKYHLEKLKKERKIRRIGPDKGGHWEVLI